MAIVMYSVFFISAALTIINALLVLYYTVMLGGAAFFIGLTGVVVLGAIAGLFIAIPYYFSRSEVIGNEIRANSCLVASQDALYPMLYLNMAVATVVGVIMAMILTAIIPAFN